MTEMNPIVLLFIHLRLCLLRLNEENILYIFPFSPVFRLRNTSAIMWIVKYLQKYYIFHFSNTFFRLRLVALYFRATFIFYSYIQLFNNLALRFYDFLFFYSY